MRMSSASRWRAVSVGAALLACSAARLAHADRSRADSALDGEGRWWPHMESMHGWAMGWWHGLGWLLVLALPIAFAVVVAVVLVRDGRRRHGDAGWGYRWGARPDRRDPTHSALKILGERFARGEIDHKEFEERRRALLSSEAPG